MSGHWYEDLLKQVMNHGVTELNARTGAHVRALPNQVVEIDCGIALPTCGLRRVFPHVAAAELAWTLSGKKSIQWLVNYTKMWNNFQEEDGTIEAAYGYRWRTHFKRDQLFQAIDALRQDRSSRQVVVLAWDPAEDGLMARKKKNVPCPLGFSINIIGNKLNMGVYVRSSDLVVGLPYDVMHYALLLDAIREELAMTTADWRDLVRGSLMMTLTHAHVYDQHFDLAWRMLDNPPEPSLTIFPMWRPHSIISQPDDYVAEVKRLAKDGLHPFHERAEAIL